MIGAGGGYDMMRRWRWNGAARALAGLGFAEMSAPVTASMKVYSMASTTRAVAGPTGKIATASV
jgi:hypothetical protein